MFVTSLACPAQEFEVAGRRITAPSGAEFIPIGANVGLWSESNSAGEVNRIKNAWRFNTVRVFLKLKQGDANYPTDAMMDRYVNAFTTDANGPRVVVMFECHDHSGGFYRDGVSPGFQELRDFWVRAASRYKDNPWVWFNIMNEPGGFKGVDPYWFTMHRDIIHAIRATGARNVIVIDGHGFASEDGNGSTKASLIKDSTSAILSQGAELLAEDPLRRLVFSLHTYQDWSWDLAKMRNFVDRVHARNLAILIGEFAASTGTSFGDIPVSRAAEYAVRVARERRIGALAWHYISWDGNPLTTASWGGEGGWNIDRTDGQRPGNLTWFGEQLWDLAHGNEASSPGVPLNRYFWTATASRGAARLAIDGYEDRSWTIGDPTAADWFKVDFGAVQTIHHVVIDPRKNAASFLRDFELYLSNSASDPGARIAAVQGNKMSVNRVSFPAASGRYLTIVPKKFGKSGHSYISWSIADLRVYTPGVYVEPVHGTVPLAKAGWKFTANKRSSWNAEWEPKAVDGDVDSRWTGGSGMKVGDWVAVDFGSPMTFRTIEISAGKSGHTYPKRYQVYLSSDGSNWGSPVFHGLGQPVMRVTFEADQTARHVRIVNQHEEGEWWAIHEINLLAHAGTGPKHAAVYSIENPGGPEALHDSDQVYANNRGGNYVIAFPRQPGWSAQAWRTDALSGGWWRVHGLRRKRDLNESIQPSAAVADSKYVISYAREASRTVQQWRFLEAENSEHVLQNRMSGKVLHRSPEVYVKNADGRYVVSAPYNGWRSQRWRLRPAP
jgi:mannan endo-1,4-beta-mannosidase